jgi:hypothetical protein
MLLIVDNKLPGAIRERLIVSYQRYWCGPLLYRHFRTPALLSVVPFFLSSAENSPHLSLNQRFFLSFCNIPRGSSITHSSGSEAAQMNIEPVIKLFRSTGFSPQPGAKVRIGCATTT